MIALPFCLAPPRRTAATPQHSFRRRRPPATSRVRTTRRSRLTTARAPPAPASTFASGAPSVLDPRPMQRWLPKRVVMPAVLVGLAAPVALAAQVAVPGAAVAAARVEVAPVVE